MKASIQNGVLVLELPLQSPRASASGKSLTVATTSGNKATELVIDGKVVVIGVNAYIPAN